MYFIWHTNHPCNLELTLLLNDINTRTGVATSTDQNQAGFSQCEAVSKIDVIIEFISRCLRFESLSDSTEGFSQ